MDDDGKFKELNAASLPKPSFVSASALKKSSSKIFDFRPGRSHFSRQRYAC